MDLRIVHLRQILSITRMVDVPGHPHLLILYGPPTDQVAEVEVNGVRGYPFAVNGETQITVTLPDLFTVRSVAVLGRTMGGLKEAVVDIGFTNQISTVSGLQSLVQMWLKTFFSTPGSDVFSKGSGGSGNRLIGQVHEGDADVSTSVAIAVRRTNEQIMKRQTGDTSIPRSEKLLSANITSFKRSPDQQTYMVDIEIKNQEGNSVRAGLG